MSTVNFLKTAVNEKRKYKGLPPYPASEFLKNDPGEDGDGQHRQSFVEPFSE